MPERLFAALDTGVLLSLTGDFDARTRETLDLLGRERFHFVAVPTVIRELVIIAEEDDQDLRDLANATLRNLSSFWVSMSP